MHMRTRSAPPEHLQEMDLGALTASKTAYSTSRPRRDASQAPHQAAHPASSAPQTRPPANCSAWRRRQKARPVPSRAARRAHSTAPDQEPGECLAAPPAKRPSARHQLPRARVEHRPRLPPARRLSSPNDTLPRTVPCGSRADLVRLRRKRLCAGPETVTATLRH